MPPPTTAFAATAIYQTPVVDHNQILTWPWAQQFQKASQQLQSPVSLNFPISSNAPGVAGQIATDGSFLYVCVSTNKWKRSALVNF